MSTTGLAKIHSPASADAFPRPRLFRRLDQLLRQPVVWVQAPAGYGKTTLAASYLEARGISPLWYQLDEGDADPASFFHYLDQAARQLTGAPKAPRVAVPRPEHLPELPLFARKAFRQLFAGLTTPGVLVFDNFQDLPDDAPLQGALAAAFEEIPPGINVLVISRQGPPPWLARLRANRHLSVLEAAELAFDRDETRALVASLGLPPLAASELEGLQRRYRGWCAGMILALQAGGGKTAAVGTLPEEVFDYLASEVFERLPVATQTLLLACALLPQISTAGAVAVSGQAGPAELLNELVQRHQFVTRTTSQPVLFQLHPLFREFLLRRGETSLDEQTHHSLQRRAADWLASEGWWPEAARLYARLGDYETIRELVREQAPALASQGRWGRLAAIIDCLPEGERHTPWLLYWQAQVAMQRDVAAARVQFERALESFRKDGDERGLCLAWAGNVDAVILAWDDFRPLDGLIDDMTARLRGAACTDPEAAARVAFGLFHALTYHRLGDPALPHWTAQVTDLMTQAPEADQRIAIACELVIHHSWMGDFAGAEQVLERTEALATDPAVSELQRIYWWHMRALMHWLHAEFAASLDALQRAEALAAQSGVRVFDFVLALLRSFLVLQTGSQREQERQIKRLHGLVGTFPGRMGQAHYHYVAGLAARLAGDGEAAHQHLLQSHAGASAIGIPFAEASSCIALARNLILLGRTDEARTWQAAARGHCEHIGSRFLDHAVALLNAELARAEGGDEQADGYLREALALGRAGGYFHYDWWLPEVMLAHGLRALELGIEVAFVQTLIHRHRLCPESPPLHLDHWPWPVRIHTLGRFGVQVDGETLRVEGQAGKRPLMLLKALVAFGGREVAEAHLSEALWPDAEGDSAHNAFTTTLSRLRKLLGADTLVVREGHLSLDPRRCWLDTWAFERALSTLEEALTRAAGEHVVTQAAQRVFALYHGEFLAREEPAGWQMAQRERLRLRLMHALKRLLAHHQQRHDCDAVLGLLERMLQLDPYEESLHRQLMRCHAGLGDRAEALAVYQRCHDLLHATFGIEPSQQTRQLHQRIREAGDTDLPHLCDTCQRPLASGA